MLRPPLLACALLLVMGLSGCLVVPQDADPCREPAEAGDGTIIAPDEPYWTLSTDRVPIPDGEERVGRIPDLAVMHNDQLVGTVTRSAVVDGEGWIERWWSCRLAELEITQVTERSIFRFVADSSEAEAIEASFIYRDPHGRDIGYPADPKWHAEGHELRRSLPEIQDGLHDVFVMVSYPDGSSRTHQFVVEYS
jgi:hypothetical protein